MEIPALTIIQKHLHHIDFGEIEKYLCKTSLILIFGHCRLKLEQGYPENAISYKPDIRPPYFSDLNALRPLIYQMGPFLIWNSLN